MEFKSGTIINDRYRLDSELGQGGMGIVFQGFDTTLRREVAVKLLSNTRLGTEGRARLLQEAQLTAKLDHPNIVTVFDAGEYEDTPFIVMQYIEGKTLAEDKPDDFDSIIQVAQQICAALEHAHQHEIIHRDLKPENTIITPEGQLKLMDFGLARSTASRLTEEGTMMGTAFYMSPEQAMGEKVNPRTDLYALGVMLYEFCTGRLPFEDENAIKVITQHINAPLVPPGLRREDLPPALNELIVALMHKESADRPPSAQAVLDLLKDPKLLETQAAALEELPLLERIKYGGLVGREEEQQEARKLWQQTLSGEGQLLLISGEPGVGKTRLMREVMTRAGVSGGIAVVGESYAESNTPYGAFVQIVRKLLQRFDHKLPGLPEHVLADLIKLAPDLAHHFPGTPPNPPLDPENEQRRMFEHLVVFFQVAAEEAALLIVVDDIHWADSGTVALFQHLVRRTKSMPVMLLGTYREVELREALAFNDLLLELNRQRAGTRLKLERLNKGTAHDMLNAIFQEEISDEFLEGIYRETDGNPFFIEEICRALVDSGKLYFADGEWHRPDIAELEIPQGIQVAVESRLKNLPEDCQQAVQMAAILGREFEYRVLAAALELGEDALIEALETAERALVIQEVKSAKEITFQFVHALVPQAIRESVRTLRRRKLHQQAAAAYEAQKTENYPALAYHYTQAGDYQHALQYHTRAGEQALAAYANTEAKEHFLAALDLVEDNAVKAGLLANLAEAVRNLGAFKEAMEAYVEAIALYLELGEKDEAAALYAAHSDIQFQTGEHAAGLETCQEGLETLGEMDAGEGYARLLAQTARMMHFNGLLDESYETGEKALAMAEELGLTAVQVDTLATLGINPNKPPQEGLALLNKAVELAEEHKLLKETPRALNNRAVISFFFDPTSEQIEKDYFRAAEIAQELGDLPSEYFYRKNIASRLGDGGRLKEADTQIKLLHEILDASPDIELVEKERLGLETSRAMHFGHFEKAIELTRKELALLRADGDLQSVFNLISTNVILYLTRFEFEEARRMAEELLELSEKWGGSKVSAQAMLSSYCNLLGDHEAGRHWLETAQQDEREQIFYAQLQLLLARGMQHIVDGEWDQARQMLIEALEASKQIRSFWYATWYKYFWALLLMRYQPEGYEAEARDFLEQALAEYEEMSADGLVDSVQEQLETLGE